MSAPRATAAAVLMVALVSPALAQSDFATRCKQWIDKKGYSTDYIEHKTGKRQPGLGPRWKGYRIVWPNGPRQGYELTCRLR